MGSRLDTVEHGVHVFAIDNATSKSTDRDIGPQVTDQSSLEISAVDGAGVGPTLNGWVFDLVNASTARLAVFEFFGGDDLTVDVGITTAHASSGSSVSPTVSAEPDLIHFAGVGLASDNQTAADHAIINYGVAWNDTTPVNAGVAYANRNGSGNTEIGSVVYTDRVGGQIIWSGETWAAEVTAFSSSSFTLTTRDGASGSDRLIWMSLNVGGGDAWAGEVELPTSAAADWNPTNPSFEPVSGGLAITNLTANDSHSTGSSAIQLSAFDGTRNFATSIASRDNVASSQEDSISSSHTVKLLNPSTAATLIELGDATLDSDGFTVPIAEADHAW